MNTILWFALSPCGSLRRSGTQRVIQGWMLSLEDEIKKLQGIEVKDEGNKPSELQLAHR